MCCSKSSLNSKMHEKVQSQYKIWPRAPNLKLNKKSSSFSIEKKSQTRSPSFGTPYGIDVEVEHVAIHENDMSCKASSKPGKVNSERGIPIGKPKLFPKPHIAKLRSGDSKGSQWVSRRGVMRFLGRVGISLSIQLNLLLPREFIWSYLQGLLTSILGKAWK